MATFLIVAGTSDIGAATAKQLKSLGHQVFITGRESNKTETIANTLDVKAFVVDAADFNALDSIFAEITEKEAPIDGVVNCAGSLLLKPAHLTTNEDYQAVIQANLTTAFATVKAAGKHLSTRGGSVVLISSAASLTGIANHEAIAAAKAGIIGLAQSAAATYANNQLRFNVIAPGLVETHLTQSIVSNPTGRKVSENMHALGRLGTALDIASAIIFFLLPENNWVTGQVLAVDGGLSRIRPRIKG